MRLKRRQYILIILIIAVGTFNFMRMRRQASPPATAPQPVARGTSPAWPLFDNVANLRDAPDEQFQPALKALVQGIDSTNAAAIPPQASPAEIAELHGCQTWLLFYRQEHLYPTTRAGWLAETKGHVDSCVTNHRDIAK